MKNTFAVSMTILLALTLGGGFLGYRLGTAEEKKPGAEATVGAEAASVSSAAGATMTAAPTDMTAAPTEQTTAPKTAAATEKTGTAAAPTESAAAGDATKGKAVFASASCAGCHGAAGLGGLGGLAPALNTSDGPKSWTLDQFHTSLRAGQSPAGPLKAPMPQFSAAQVSDDDVANIYAYIKTLN